MPWKNLQQYLVSLDFVSLKSDGDTVELYILDEPVARKSEMRGKPRIQIAFAVATDEGLKVWTVGTQLAAQIERSWSDLLRVPLRVTRHGKKGDTDTHYELKPHPDNQLLITKAKSIDEEIIATTLAKIDSFTGGENGGEAWPSQPPADYPF